LAVLTTAESRDAAIWDGTPPAGQAGRPGDHRDLPERTPAALSTVLSGGHPAITSIVIGPKTMAQLDDLLATGVRLDPAVLDAIDEVVPPGTDIAGIKHLTGNPSLSRQTAAAPADPPQRHPTPTGCHDGGPRNALKVLWPSTRTQLDRRHHEPCTR
jgi:hypothetical protein